MVASAISTYAVAPGLALVLVFILAVGRARPFSPSLHRRHLRSGSFLPRQLRRVWTSRDDRPCHGKDITAFHADAVLVLGGDRHRELTAVRLFMAGQLESLHPPPARAHAFSPAIHLDYDQIPLFVSSGALSPDELPPATLHPFRRIVLDRRALCTLTNFTSLLPTFRAAKIRHVLVVTSQSHLSRAMTVGRIVLRSQGIRVCGLGVEDGGGEEGWGRRGRDALRASWWVWTGWEGREVVRWAHPTRKEGQ
ncbi:hypothetical protein NSK_006807 [Nannochloropsis salina CCMP1776]|uniref:DUF218 domain-containing protein n=1 Tax=Nannochloropsis salina CCMP1776 TaxID=1027361 RepID=A0A4D9CRW9_9STRA|nr:hypothetical protein NSK_006807 [Nannochloropsis salina CCMP1776]|eukprot:TFJ81556.1 hypothetical protein NSK_006807 [Nannochloropsis salina CCMP1776]